MFGSFENMSLNDFPAQWKDKLEFNNDLYLDANKIHA